MCTRVVFTLLILLTGGCSVTPPLPSERRVAIAEVVDRVQCELAAAVKPYLHSKEHGWIKNWAAAYSLTLKVEDESSVVASSDFIANPGVLTLSANLGVTGTATRTATLDFSLYVAELEKYDCQQPERTKGRYFSSDTGMAEWMDRIMASMDVNDKVHVPTKFGHTLEFTVKVNAGAGPAWVFERYKPKGSLAGSRKDTHNLGIAFTKRAGDPDPCGDKVQVTNLPAWMKEPPPGWKSLTTEMAPAARKKAQQEEWKKIIEECRERYWGGKNTPPIVKGRSRFTPVDPATQYLLDRTLESLDLKSRNILISP